MDVIKAWMMRRMSYLWREMGDPRRVSCIQGEGDNRGFHEALRSTSRGPRAVRRPPALGSSLLVVSRGSLPFSFPFRFPRFPRFPSSTEFCG
jgi:hypothetical protein